MPDIHSRLGRLALTISMAAMAVLAGSAATQASVREPGSGLTWHKLDLANGWHAYLSSFDTGSPSWAVKGGVVYLSGAMHQTSGTSTLFAILPSKARPRHNLWVTVYTGGETTGSLYISASGDIEASSNPSSYATGFTSLAGVSYPARSMSQKKVSLINGWHSAARNNGNPSYSLSDGIVYLSGSLATSEANTEWAVLPKAARPKHAEWISVFTVGGTPGWLTIYPNGKALASSLGSTASYFTSLAGVSYPARSASSHTLTLRNGWHSEQATFHSGNPAYLVKGGVVYLSGSMATSGSAQEFARLPRSARPRHNLWIKTYTADGTAGGLEITALGNIYAFSLTPSDAENYTSLAAISYPITS